MIKVRTYEWVPPFAQGLVRDLRVRWALEEAGILYKEDLISHPDRLKPEHIAKQPFAQIPTYEEDGLVMFESGAIVLHIAEKSEALLPRDSVGRAHALEWVFAALNSIEQWVQEFVLLDAFYGGEEWSKLRKPSLRAQTVMRLTQLSDRLGDREFLEDRFTVGDLMMSTVLRILRGTDVLEELPRLAAYRERCETRPAFQKALADQMAVYPKHSPPSQWQERKAQ